MYYSGNDCGPGLWDRQMQISPVNITDSGDAYTINLYAPRLNKEQFTITTRQDVLSVKYDESKQADKSHYTRKEYRPGDIDRSFDLKGKVEIERISATYTDGVLSIYLPKTDSARKQAQKVSIS
jgi:HSP20 family protein